MNEETIEVVSGPGVFEVDASKIAAIIIYKFLYVQQCTQLNIFQRTVTVFCNAQMCFAFIAFAHFILRYIIIFRAV